MNIALLAVAGLSVVYGAKHYDLLPEDNQAGKKLANLYSEMMEKCNASDEQMQSLENWQTQLIALQGREFDTEQDAVNAYTFLNQQTQENLARWEQLFELCEKAQKAYDQFYRQKLITSG